MVVAKSLAVCLKGLDGTLVEVETEISQGLPAFTIVGLPDSSTLQAKERVRSALGNCGYLVSDRKITVNLTPAWLPKQGSGFDLAIAIGALAALKVISPAKLENILFLGELTLDAQVRAVPGVLPSVRAAVSQGISKIMVPAANFAEAKLVSGAKVIAIQHLSEAIEALGGKVKARIKTSVSQVLAFQQVNPRPYSSAEGTEEFLDFSQVQGQSAAISAAEVVAAGGHHLLMMGTPGSGKTMIASRIPTILPELDNQTALTLSAINSICGKFQAGSGLNTQAPFIAPHHTASPAAIIGGGSSLAMPGAISQAHGGILFLDEAPEFSSRVLEALREPLEKGEIALHRAKGATIYPARFQLILAANPCPCGNAIGKAQNCTCSAQEIRRYKSRISGPILDRIDVRIQVRSAKINNRAANPEAATAQSSSQIRERVLLARQRQLRRLMDTPWTNNAMLPSSFLDEKMPLPPSEEKMILRCVEKMTLTMRGRDRVRKIAWTLADLNGKAQPGEAEVGQALFLRGDSLL